MEKTIFNEEISDSVLCEIAESFEVVVHKEKEEQKTVEKSRFVELSEDELDVIVDRAEAKATKNSTKWGVKLFEGNKNNQKI